MEPRTAMPVAIRTSPATLNIAGIAKYLQNNDFFAEF
jgi:hypothetical protein